MGEAVGGDFASRRLGGFNSGELLSFYDRAMVLITRHSVLVSFLVAFCFTVALFLFA